MKKAIFALALAFTSSVAFSSDSLYVPVPTEWQGIRFGLNKIESVKQMRARLKNVKVSDLFTTADAMINGKSVSTTFYFDDNLGLYKLFYVTRSISYFEAEAALRNKFGHPTSTNIIMGNPTCEWLWNDPYFRVMLLEGSGQTLVQYDSVDPEIFAKREEESKQRKIEEAKKSSKDF